jgi:hypothetical protein
MEQRGAVRRAVVTSSSQLGNVMAAPRIVMIGTEGVR